MKKTIEIFSAVILISILPAFNWPLQNGHITSTFGESRGDHFHDGTDMISGEKSVFPIEDGNTVFSWNKALFPFDNYGGNGNYQIIQHSDKYVSIYLHLEDNLQISESYSVNTPIGIFGNTGRSYGNHIHFSLYDNQSFESFNPFPLFPEIMDKKAPIIDAIAVKVGDKTSIVSKNAKIRMTQNWPFLVKTHDVINGGERLGVYRIQIIVNGQYKKEYVFNQLGFTKNGLTISDLTFDNVYTLDGFVAFNGIPYSSGINTFKLFLTDYAGNVTVDEYNLDITISE